MLQGCQKKSPIVEVSTGEHHTTASPIVEVSIGMHHTTASPNVMLSTNGLTYCSALAVLYGMESDTGVYQNRTLIHLVGGNIEQGLFGDSTDATGLIERLTSEVSENPYTKVILVFGVDSSNYFSRTVLGQRKTGQEECRPLLRLLDKAREIDMGKSGSLKVTPTGQADLGKGECFSKDAIAKLIESVGE